MLALKQEIENVLRQQGYRLYPNGFFLDVQSKDFLSDKLTSLRNTHELAKMERIAGQKKFIQDNADFIQSQMVDGNDLSVEKIEPVLLTVKTTSNEEKIFRWWNYVWWSLPYEKAYGRQMRYVVWDKYHKAPIGLIGLQSPILSWAPRDTYLNIPTNKKDYWINQSMNIQRLGAIPPYNRILGGKLVAMLVTSDNVRLDFKKKYHEKETLMLCRKIPADLLFVTTTGAFGKSSIYTRLKFKGNSLAQYIGKSNGSGSFHIPNSIYAKMLDLMESRGFDVSRGYGRGPSRKMRLIDQGMKILGYKNGNHHGIQRAIYFFPFVKNLNKLISGSNHRRLWHHRSQSELTEFWKEHWILPRIEKRTARGFDKKQFIQDELEKLRVL